MRKWPAREAAPLVDYSQAYCESPPIDRARDRQLLTGHTYYLNHLQAFGRVVGGGGVASQGGRMAGWPSQRSEPEAIAKRSHPSSHGVREGAHVLPQEAPSRGQS